MKLVRGSKLFYGILLCCITVAAAAFVLNLPLIQINPVKPFSVGAGWFQGPLIEGLNETFGWPVTNLVTFSIVVSCHAVATNSTAAIVWQPNPVQVTVPVGGSVNATFTARLISPTSFGGTCSYG